MQFEWYGFRAGDVRYDKPRQASKRPDRLGKIALLWSLEVKHHRDEIATPQLGSEEVENCLSVIGEPAQQQNALLADRIDHRAYLLVVEEQVDELGHFDVVNRNCMLLRSGNHEVVLNGAD